MSRFIDTNNTKSNHNSTHSRRALQLLVFGLCGVCVHEEVFAARGSKRVSNAASTAAPAAATPAVGSEQPKGKRTSLAVPEQISTADELCKALYGLFEAKDKREQVNRTLARINSDIRSDTARVNFVVFSRLFRDNTGTVTNRHTTGTQNTLINALVYENDTATAEVRPLFCKIHDIVMGENVTDKYNTRHNTTIAHAWENFFKTELIKSDMGESILKYMQETQNYQVICEAYKAITGEDKLPEGWEITPPAEGEARGSADPVRGNAADNAEPARDEPQHIVNALKESEHNGLTDIDEISENAEKAEKQLDEANKALEAMKTADDLDSEIPKVTENMTDARKSDQITTPSNPGKKCAHTVNSGVYGMYPAPKPNQIATVAPKIADANTQHANKVTPEMITKRNEAAKAIQTNSLVRCDKIIELQKELGTDLTARKDTAPGVAADAAETYDTDNSDTDYSNLSNDQAKALGKNIKVTIFAAIIPDADPDLDKDNAKNVASEVVGAVIGKNQTAAAVAVEAAMRALIAVLPQDNVQDEAEWLAKAALAVVKAAVDATTSADPTAKATAIWAALAALEAGITDACPAAGDKMVTLETVTYTAARVATALSLGSTAYKKAATAELGAIVVRQVAAAGGDPAAPIKAALAALEAGITDACPAAGDEMVTLETVTYTAARMAAALFIEQYGLGKTAAAELGAIVVRQVAAAGGDPAAPINAALAALEAGITDACPAAVAGLTDLLPPTIVALEESVAPGVAMAMGRRRMKDALRLHVTDPDAETLLNAAFLVAPPGVTIERQAREAITAAAAADAIKTVKQKRAAGLPSLLSPKVSVAASSKMAPSSTDSPRSDSSSTSSKSSKARFREQARTVTHRGAQATAVISTLATLVCYISASTVNPMIPVAAIVSTALSFVTAKSKKKK